MITETACQGPGALFSGLFLGRVEENPLEELQGERIFFQGVIGKERLAEDTVPPEE